MTTGKNKADNGKRKAKTAQKKKKKTTPKTESTKKGEPKTTLPANDGTERNAEKRVAAMREKLKKTLEDPEMRDQIVRAIRTMLNEGR